MSAPPNLEYISNQIIAIAALGTAAFGLVDATKAFWGGISRIGFGVIKRALKPFDAALSAALGDKDGDGSWEKVLRSHWINGRPKAEQKAIAVSLVQLGLTQETAKGVAEATNIDPADLLKVIKALVTGKELEPDQLNLLGRFKATIEARLDAAYERADQMYRNTARLAAGLVAVGLAVVAQQLFYPQTQLISAVLIGLIAVPLAPVARDLVSTLSAAARAVRGRVTP
jgi:hypothetical protein